MKYKDYLESSEKTLGLQGEPLSLAVFHSCTLEPIEPVLRRELAELGFSPAVRFYGFNIFEQELLNPAGEYAKERPDVVLLFFTLQEFFPELLHEFHTLSPSQLEEKKDKVVSRIQGLLEAVRAKSQARVIVSAFDFLAAWHYGILDRGQDHSQQEVLSRLNRDIARLAGSFKEVYVLDVQEASRTVGKRSFYDWGMYYHSSLPFSGEGLVELGRMVARIVFAAYGKTKKCVVLDLDNTLWGGIVGEEGADRVLVGPTGQGRAYYDFQRELKKLSSRGIVLAVASKNNPEDVKEVFAKRKNDMPLLWEDFVITKIGWELKPESFQEIAQELDIGLDSMVFLDDSPVERAMVREFLPEVYTPELPESASEYASFLQELPVFEKNIYSREDFKKVQMYKEQGKRAALKQETPSLEDFWKGLEMRLTIFVNEKTQIPRLAQMTQKTNQFNLTTKRYSELAISEFMENNAWKVFSWSVQDRFGDNGVVGLLIAEIAGEEARIDVLLQSCRVIGRTIEQAVISRVASVLKAAGVTRITGSYIPTAKNSVAKDVLARLGFEKQEGDTYILNLSLLPQAPPWFQAIEMK